MKHAIMELPSGISEYIKDHFRDEFLCRVKDVREVKGRRHYKVEVATDNYIHSLTFNENGDVLEDETDEAYPPDLHDEWGFGDTPE